MHDDDLSPEEREALGALPRALDPGRALEDRTVRALRARGLLQPPAPLRLGLPPAWWVGAAAACLLVFAGGLALGAWLEARNTTRVVLDLRERDAAAAAAVVQRTGSAYVSALAALAGFAETARPQELATGREAAVNALHAAASQMVRLAPEDPVAVQILRGLSRAAAPDSVGTAGEPRRVVWF